MTDLSATKATLKERLQRLLARADRVEDELSQPGDDDFSENATEAEGDEVLEEVGRGTMKEIRSIRDALEAIDAGTYGTCAECGAKIAKARLEALPEAVECKACAQMQGS